MRRLSLEEKAGFGHPYGNAAFGRLLHRLRAVPLPFQGRHGLRAAALRRLAWEAASQLFGGVEGCHPFDLLYAVCSIS